MHFAQPGEVTLARLTRCNGQYWMAIVPAEEFLASYRSNHTHGCYGNWVDELVAISKILKIDYNIFS